MKRILWVLWILGMWAIFATCKQVADSQVSSPYQTVNSDDGQDSGNGIALWDHNRHKSSNGIYIDYDDYVAQTKPDNPDNNELMSVRFDQSTCPVEQVFVQTKKGNTCLPVLGAGHWGTKNAEYTIDDKGSFSMTLSFASCSAQSIGCRHTKVNCLFDKDGKLLGCSTEGGH